MVAGLVGGPSHGAPVDVLAAVRQLQELTAPLNQALKNLSARTEIDSATDKMTTNLLTSRDGFGQSAGGFPLAQVYDRRALGSTRVDDVEDGPVARAAR